MTAMLTALLQVRTLIGKVAERVLEISQKVVKSLLIEANLTKEINPKGQKDPPKKEVMEIIKSKLSLL